MRTVKYSVRVLRGNIPVGELVFEQPPAITSDYTAEIHTGLRGTFRHDDTVDYITADLAPVMEIDGTEYPLGVYKIASVSSAYSDAGVRMDTIEAYDRSIQLKWAKLESREFFAAGTAYTDIVSNLLTRAGITRAVVVNSANVLQSDREDWDIGTPYLEIINTLLSEINYSPIWFDLTGSARVEPYAAPSAANIAHRYGTADGIRLVGAPISTEMDIFEAPNVFVAILENPEYPEPLVATAVNDTPASRLSTVTRGIRIPQIYKVDNTASAEELQAYVDRIRNESMQMSEYVTMTSANMPGHNVGDVIALSHPQAEGIFREVGWNMTLSAGSTMSHRLQKVVII